MNPELGMTRFRLTRVTPAAELALYVELHWVVEWDLRGREPFVQEVLPHPTMHLAVEPELEGIWGVQSERTSLQRRFRDYVGVGPKWVLQRYRLHDAAERMASGQVADWARVALDLGYFDQAHFVNDFRAAIGKPPAEYAADCAAARERMAA